MHLPSLRMRIVVVALVAGLLLSCAHETQISVSGGAAPVFNVRGSAKLTSFKVWGSEADPNGGIGAGPNIVKWQIEPTGTAGDSSLDALQQIQYGVVPKGFVQRVPNAGSPPPLKESTQYSAEFATVNAPNHSLSFSIRNGKAISGGTADLHNIPSH